MMTDASGWRSTAPAIKPARMFISRSYTKSDSSVDTRVRGMRHVAVVLLSGARTGPRLCFNNVRGHVTAAVRIVIDRFSGHVMQSMGNV